MVKLRVHSWGGLGSQLFALSLIFNLRRIFPKREVLLIHHTSGVTRRIFELEFLLDSGTELRTIDDFKSVQQSNYDKLPKKFLKSNLKRILEQTKFYIDYDRTKDLSKIKYWTIMLRGHYSHAQISQDFYRSCIEKFRGDEKSTTSSSLVIHYRLGDLVDLNVKSIIPSKRIIERARIALKAGNYEKVIIFSDSPKEAMKSLSKIKNFIKEVEFSNRPTVEVIKNSIGAKYFIGTNSKVSIWIVKFRDNLALPSEKLEHRLNEI
jgi:hypothetical protein